MEFRGREEELSILERIRGKSRQRGQMTVVTGRRRMGKTRLIKESLRGERYLYFFVSRKAEVLLCEEYTALIRSTYGIEPIGRLTTFREVFAYLLHQARSEPINLVIDEFQEFLKVNPSVFADLQNLWDASREEVRMNLILSGSVTSLMRRIFEHRSEPLFGRVNHRLYVRPLPVADLRGLLKERTGTIIPEDLLCLYLITGGVPKYLEELADNDAFTKEAILNAVTDPGNYFLDEGRNVLTEEFGNASSTYFSILTLIAAGRTTRGDIKSVLQKDVGPYLRILAQDYDIISSEQPIFSKPNARNLRYRIDDKFLNFWFRFFFKFKSALEIGNVGFLRQVIERDYPTYAGMVLEQLIRQQLAESGAYSRVGRYWRRGNQREIDVVAINELTKRGVIGEVNLNPAKVSPPKLRDKSIALEEHLRGYEMEVRGFGLPDLTE